MTARGHPWTVFAILVSVWLVTLPRLAGASESDLLLVVHPSVQTPSISRDTARAIFAMRQRTWPNGQAIHVVVLPNRYPMHERFTKELLGVYPHQLQLSWDRLVFSGTGQAPEQVETPDDMLERIATTPGAVGYIERGYLDERVHVLPME
ncbi:hypothetical protein GCM10007160_27350 [Litchfieldella qijiaojingensis]|uniref:PBP domain-containing protein n=1 Tax=Litchfieldella qijiaojingensis TaxID=980347 RepID=A0ABQ2Z0S0_9GAMM|nr:hypothetical protein [Halomonas qijiaojingensis]GGX98350.1 hypothetical protein GCM10007160_27350 [Halomonas qijiaojingensis]